MASKRCAVGASQEGRTAARPDAGQGGVRQPQARCCL